MYLGPCTHVANTPRSSQSLSTVTKGADLLPSGDSTLSTLMAFPSLSSSLNCLVSATSIHDLSINELSLNDYHAKRRGEYRAKVQCSINF